MTSGTLANVRSVAEHALFPEYLSVIPPNVASLDLYFAIEPDASAVSVGLCARLVGGGTWIVRDLIPFDELDPTILGPLAVAERLDTALRDTWIHLQTKL